MARRNGYAPLLIFAGSLWVGTLYAGGSRAPSNANRAPAVTGEVKSPSESTPATGRPLVAPAQKPAPEIENEIRSFGGRREPPSVTELSFEPTGDGRYRILQTDPRRKTGDRNHPAPYQPNEIVDEIPLPPSHEDEDETSAAPEKSSAGASRAPASR